MKEDLKGRRKFLKLAGFSALAIPFLPTALVANNEGKLVQSTCTKTTLDFYGEGPFYTSNPPTIQNGQLADANEPGTRLILSGRVFNLDCTQWLPNTEIDIWHADNNGDYDNSGYNLRGKTTANAQGFYTFETIYPGKYLNGSQYRPAHIHLKITPPGGSTLTTQIYFAGDTDIPNDAAASISSGTYDATGRTIALSMSSGKWEGTWDIVMDGNGITDVEPDLHLQRGMIYMAKAENGSVNFRYGVFRTAQISLLVFDMNGRMVGELKQGRQDSGKFDINWTPNYPLGKGIYFVALQANDQQIHYMKFRVD